MSQQVPSEVLSWVSKSRKLEKKKDSEKEKARQLSKVFEEAENVDEEESKPLQHTSNLAGVKILHGLDKVIEGGAVVLTLKDQSILADGDLNEDVDMLENIEIGEQKLRDDAYKAAKKKTGVYEDKFNEDPFTEKKMLPQYDDKVLDEGVTLDEQGRFSGQAEKKLEELRRRLQGSSTSMQFEDLSTASRNSSDYYTHEEMLQFKKPKKKKSLRRREKLNIEALEAEAVAAGLGGEDLGSRNNKRKQNQQDEQEKSESELRSSAYQSAYAKAEEASKALRHNQALSSKQEDENSVLIDEDEDFHKSLKLTRNLALRKQSGLIGAQAVALLASSIKDKQAVEEKASPIESQSNKVVFTEMEEFVTSLQLDEGAQNNDKEDVFMDEDDERPVSDTEDKIEATGWTEVKDLAKDEIVADETKEEIVLDETIHEVPVGKGLSGALRLLKDRGSLKDTVEWGGRNTDKKKSKLVGIHDTNEPKEIRIERLDEFGRIMTPKEAFRMLSHKFHGKEPGKMKKEKRIKQVQEELKMKQMKNSDTPSLSVERMREAQSRLQTPYLVLSGHVKPGQTSDPRSGFATVEKGLPGSLTPMLGDRKVEHFLGIKSSKPEAGDMLPPIPKKSKH